MTRLEEQIITRVVGHCNGEASLTATITIRLEDFALTERQNPHKRAEELKQGIVDILVELVEDHEANQSIFRKDQS